MALRTPLEHHNTSLSGIMPQFLHLLIIMTGGKTVALTFQRLSAKQCLFLMRPGVRASLQAIITQVSLVTPLANKVM